MAAPSRWDEALQVAALFALDPAGLVGVVLRASAGPVRDRWLAELRRLLPEGAPWRTIPLNVQDARLLGGLDLAATLAAGRPVAERGLLVDADGGVVLLAMAERVSPGTAARLAAVLDSGEVSSAREGIAQRHASRFGVIALDEGIEGEAAPMALRDRLAFSLDLGPIAPREAASSSRIDRRAIDRARLRLPTIHADDAIAHALCAAAAALGIASMRPPWLALRVARALAALNGRPEVDQDDAVRAAQLVLAPRARTAPPPEERADEAPDHGDDDPADSPENADASSDDADESSTQPTQALDEVVLEATAAAIPAGLLQRLASGRAAVGRRSGASGGWQSGAKRGAPAGVRKARPRSGQRLNLIATLRAAAPWQRVRAQGSDGRPRLRVRVEDFHLTRFRQRSTTTTIFVIDASGSAALHRLAEAKGAVELLLADCYVRRDQVAVLGFRGQRAELLLPPTRSLVRAKRSLAGLPGGGGTPLAAALDATIALADVVRRHGDLPLAVLLTDGRANVARDGSGGRARAEADALASAQRLRAAGLDVLLIDTSPQPQPQAQRLAAAMGATYLALPHAGATTMSAAVRELQRSSGAAA